MLCHTSVLSTTKLFSWPQWNAKRDYIQVGVQTQHEDSSQPPIFYAFPIHVGHWSLLILLSTHQVFSLSLGYPISCKYHWLSKIAEGPLKWTTYPLVLMDRLVWWTADRCRMWQETCDVRDGLGKWCVCVCVCVHVSALEGVSTNLLVLKKNAIIG